MFTAHENIASYNTVPVQRIHSWFVQSTPHVKVHDLDEVEEDGRKEHMVIVE
jgi:hypothetical protein